MLIFRIDQDKEISILIIKGIHNKLQTYLHLARIKFAQESLSSGEMIATRKH